MLPKIKNFLNEVKQIIKEITWPKQETLIQLTVVVILVSAIVGAILGGADYLFTKFISWLTLQ
jgi:preprotein translocase SecE subunit